MITPLAILRGCARMDVSSVVQPAVDLNGCSGVGASSPAPGPTQEGVTMPKRIIDGEAMWGSTKLEACPDFAAVLYPWLLPLADAYGSFEITSLRILWSRVAMPILSILPEPADLGTVLDCFIEHGLLVAWQDGGRRYAHWTGIERDGLLPPSSRKHYEKRRAPDLTSGAELLRSVTEANCITALASDSALDLASVMDTDSASEPEKPVASPKLSDKATPKSPEGVQDAPPANGSSFVPEALQESPAAIGRDAVVGRDRHSPEGNQNRGVGIDADSSKGLSGTIAPVPGRTAREIPNSPTNQSAPSNQGENHGHRERAVPPPEGRGVGGEEPMATGSCRSMVEVGQDPLPSSKGQTVEDDCFQAAVDAYTAQFRMDPPLDFQMRPIIDLCSRKPDITVEEFTGRIMRAMTTGKFKKLAWFCSEYHQFGEQVQPKTFARVAQDNTGKNFAEAKEILDERKRTRLALADSSRLAIGTKPVGNPQLSRGNGRPDATRPSQGQPQHDPLPRRAEDASAGADQELFVSRLIERSASGSLDRNGKMQPVPRHRMAPEASRSTGASDPLLARSIDQDSPKIQERKAELKRQLERIQ